MSPSAEPAETTRRFARVLGPFFTIVSATVVARARRTSESSSRSSDRPRYGPG